MKSKLLVVVTMFVAAAVTWAHHGTSGFDLSKSLHLSGTISQTEWANPHVMIHLNVTGADGKVTERLVGCPPPNWMKRTGLTQNLLDVGTEIDVEGYPAKDGSNRLVAANCTITQNDRKLTIAGPIGWK